jgi:hypothetical protein
VFTTLLNKIYTQYCEYRVDQEIEEEVTKIILRIVKFIDPEAKLINDQPLSKGTTKILDMPRSIHPIIIACCPDGSSPVKTVKINPMDNHKEKYLIIRLFSGLIDP